MENDKKPDHESLRYFTVAFQTGLNEARAVAASGDTARLTEILDHLDGLLDQMRTRLGQSFPSRTVAVDAPQRMAMSVRLEQPDGRR